MKKTIIFGVFAITLMVINVLQSVQCKQNGFSLGQLYNLASAATSEGGDNIWDNELLTEQGICMHCEQEYGVRWEVECTCTRYTLMCILGGNEACDDTPYISEYNCHRTGNKC